MNRYVPMLVSPSILKVLVIGGGNVALRKCQHFKGADITIMADHVSEEIAELASKTIEAKAELSRVKRMMKDFDIIVASTDDKELNERIRDAALSERVPVNSAHGGGTVLIPSVLERERYIISASTGGKVPAFLPFLIGELDLLLDERFDMMFDVLSEVRTASIGKGTQKQRSEYLKAVYSDPEIRRHIERGDIRSALNRAKETEVLK